MARWQRFRPYFLVFVLPVLLAALLAAATAWFSLSDLRNQYQTMSQRQVADTEALALASEFNAELASVQRMVTATLRQVTSGQVAERVARQSHAQLVHVLLALEGKLPRLDELTAGSQDFEHLRGHFESYRNTVILASDTATLDPAAAMILANDAIDIYLEMTEHTQRFISQGAEAASNRALEQGPAFERRLVRGAVLFAALLGALSLIWLMVSVRMLGRITRLTDALQAMARGETQSASLPRVQALADQGSGILQPVAQAVLSFRDAIVERDAAQGDLDKRMRELTCLYDVFRATEQTDLDLQELLAFIERRIPQALRFPDRAVCSVRFGTAQATQNLQAETGVLRTHFAGSDGVPDGLIEVRYDPPPVQQDVLFLPEEQTLIATIGQRLARTLALQAVHEEQDETQALLGAVVEQAPLAIDLVEAAALRTVQTNVTSCRVLGYSRGERLALALADIVEPASLSGLLGAVQTTLALGNAGYEGRFRRKDGQQLEVHADLSVIRRGGRDYLVVLWSDVTEAHQTSDRLRKLSMAVEQSPHAVVITDLQARIVFINDAFERTTGYRRGEVLGRNPRLLSAGKTPRADIEAMWRTLTAGEQWTGLFINRTKDGRERLESAIITPLRDAHGQISNYVAVKEDITERRQSEEMLRKLYLAVEQSPASIVITNLQAQIEYVNQAFTRATGYTPQEALGLNPRVLKSGRTPKATYESMWSALGRGEPWSGLLFNRRKDGSEYQELAHITPVRLPDGTVSHYLAIKEDVTEKRRINEELQVYREHLEDLVESRTAELAQASDALRRASEEQAAVFDTASSGMALIRHDTLARCNRRLHDIVGWPAGSLEGQSAKVWYADPERDAAEIGELAARMRNGEPQRLERQLRRRDGSLFWARMTGKLIDVADPEQGAVWVIDDITVEREALRAITHAKEAAEDAARTKSSFLANMSHEIRTPLNAVIGMTHLALSTELSPRQRDYLKKIQRSGQHLLGIINDILDVSKIEAGKLSIEQVPFELDAVLAHAGTLVAERAHAKGLELIVALDPDVPRALVGDPLRLTQILTNYANNAVKFTQHGEVAIHVGVDQTGPHDVLLRFSVRDTGIGLSAEQRESLFQSFQQADASTTRKFGGTGLGLAISKSLATLMHGSVGVESALGAGSTFWFTARLGLGQASAAGRTLQTDQQAALRGQRALVVDGNASACRVLEQGLQQLGVQAVVAPDASQALSLLREHLATSAQVFDYVFVDAHLPDHDGTGLIDQLLALDWPRLPHCVLLARYGSPEAQREGDHPGVSALLTKPLHARALGDCLTQLQAGLQADGGEGSTLPADRTELERLRGARVLLVEDNDLNQEVACELLRELGLEVDVAENGEQAVHQVAQQPYDLVLMDMQMPVMDGLEATRRIRASGQHDALPIIAMTANVLESDRQRCLEAGMNAHLAKPIDPEELWPLLLQWIRQSAAPAAPAVVSQARTASRPDGELPPLPVQGLDVDAGLHHAMGRPALYLSLLRRFADAQEAVLSAAHQALASGELPVLVRLAHTIKGSAGTIGARTIQQAANQLERSAAANEPRETLAERLHALELPLRQMANELHAVLPPVEPSRTSAPRPDPQRLQGICDQLESMLDGGNAHAADTLDEHAAQLRQAFPAHFARIERAVRSFDFELALETLRAARSASP